VDEEFAILLFWLGVSLTANVALLVGWLRANRRTRRLENQLFAPPQANIDDARVDQLERSMDQLSGQLDQIANGQEFLNRVMSERLDRWPRVKIEAPPETTPH
jgi:hypothetical protein